MRTCRREIAALPYPKARDPNPAPVIVLPPSISDKSFAGEWMDPDFLERIRPTGARVRLTAGAPASTALKLTAY